jgi:hypothetical protein
VKRKTEDSIRELTAVLQDKDFALKQLFTRVFLAKLSEVYDEQREQAGPKVKLIREYGELFFDEIIDRIQSPDDVRSAIDRILGTRDYEERRVAISRFVEHALWLVEKLGSPWLAGTDFPRVVSLAETPEELYYQCRGCKSYITVSQSNPDCSQPIICPKCSRELGFDYESPWPVVTRDSPHYRVFGKFIRSERFYWKHKWFQKLVLLRNRLIGTSEAN